MNCMKCADMHRKNHLTNPQHHGKGVSFTTKNSFARNCMTFIDLHIKIMFLTLNLMGLGGGQATKKIIHRNLMKCEDL